MHTCAFAQLPKLAEAVLVVVGDKIVLMSDFENDLSQFKLQMDQEITDDIRCEILKQIIVKKMMINQAELDSIPMPDDRVDAELDNRIRYFMRQIGGQEEFERYLGKSIQEYKNEIRPKMVEELLSREMEGKITADIKISPREVRAFYDSIPKDSLPIIPVEVEISQMIFQPVVSTVAKEYAKSTLQDLRNRILNGSSFETLAKAYSQDPSSGKEGGLLPEFGRGDMVPEFERVAFKLKPDSISEIFESDFGYHIIKLISRRGERVICKHILIRPEITRSDLEDAAKRADTAYQKLLNKEMDFCSVVKKYSDNDQNSKGYCGFLMDESTGGVKILLEMVPPDIKAAIDALTPGSYSKPTIAFTEDGNQYIRIIYLKSITTPHLANIDQDYDRIQIEALNTKKSQAIEQWVNKTRKETFIKVNTTIYNCPSLLDWNNKL